MAEKKNRDERGHFLPQRSQTRTVYVLDFDEDGWCPELAMDYRRGRRVTTCDANMAYWLRKYASSCIEKEVEA